MMTLNYIKDIVYSAVADCDSSILFNSFVRAELEEEDIENIFTELGELLPSSVSNSADDERLTSNVLQVLSDIIVSLNTSINNKKLCLHLAKSALHVIVDEHCSVNNMKKALIIFNATIQNPEVIKKLVGDSALEGSLQIFGRKVSSVGDYGCQVLLVENMWIIANPESCTYWINVWFSEPSAREKFINLNLKKFDSCRQLLNYINRNEPERRVFSILANSVTFGSLQLKRPKQCELWIDFNYDSQSISFFCSEISCDDVSSEKPGMWETVLIDSPSVKYFSIIERKAEQKNELVLLLNRPCNALFTSSFTHHEYDSYEVRIILWNLTEVYTHLEIIYGKEKYVYEYPVEKITKSSVAEDVIQIVNEEPGGLYNQVSSQRKASSSSFPIAIDACENEDFVPETDQNQNFSVFRKISQSVETINFTTEVSSVEVRNLGDRKISTSSECIQVDTFMVSEGDRQKTRRRSSVSIDTVLFQPNEEYSNNENHVVENEPIPSSNETGKERKSRVPEKGSSPTVRETKIQVENKGTEKKLSSTVDSLESQKTSESAKKRVNISELKEKQKVKSDDPKLLTSRKKTKSLELVELAAKEQQIRLYDDFSADDEDFQELSSRDSGKRKRRKSSETSTASKWNLSRKRKFEASGSVTNGKPAKIQRKAAVKSMRKTRKLLDNRSEVQCNRSYDAIEVIDESKENSANASHTLKRRYSIGKTDTDTHSSEVSWMKPKKSYLFESPKKNYSEWRKSLQKKKELSVEIIPDTNSRVKRNSSKRKKKDVSANLHSDSKSLGWSDLDNYNLTVEKNCQRSSYSRINALESDLKNISKGGSKTNSRKRSYLSSSQENVLESNSDFNCSLRKKIKNTTEVTCNEKQKKSKIMHEVSYGTQDRHTSSISKAKNSGGIETFSNVENGQNKTSDNDFEAEVGICDNHAGINEEITPPAKYDEIIQVENDEECENIQSKHPLVNTSEQLSGVYSANEFKNRFRETEGKSVILDRFLESVVEFSGKLKDSTRSSLQETTSMPTSPDPYQPHLSNKSFSDGMELAMRDEASENQDVDNGDNLSLQHPCDKNADNLEEPDRKIKNKANESLFSTKIKKQLSSGYDIAIRNSSLGYRMSEKADTVQSRISADIVIDSISHQNMRKGKSVNKDESEKLTSSSKKNEPRKFSKKHKKSKDFNNSYSSLFSQLTSASVVNVIKDKKWFYEITSLLSKNASDLSRKLLATVQKCFFEFSSKMNTLRENLLKTAKVFEIPPSQSMCEYKLKYLMKNCKTIRLEVEKSLRRMHHTGKEYFEAEEKFYRRLKRKQTKANRKFIANMQEVERNAATKLEEKVLLKTKYFMKMLLRHIESA